DEGRNTLTGAADLDLFFGASLRDTHDRDRAAGEVFVDSDGIEHVVHIDPRALSGSFVALDYVTHEPATPFSVTLLPGQHFVYAYGSTITWFTVNADGTIDYDAALEGVLTGKGTRSLTVRGATVQVDASALSGSFLSLDYVTHDPATPFSVTLLPGQHFVYAYGSTITWFTVNADGTIDYDAALEGVLTGRGTRTLGIHGVTVQVDASALSGSFLSLDYVTHDPATPFGVTLLPGQHFVYGYGSTITWFTVNADGTIDYDAALEGVLTGRGTRTLGIHGATVQVD